MIWTYGAIAFFGVLGCWARYAQANLVQLVYGRDFPYATLTINVMGSFLMGFLFVETLERLTLAPWIRTGILTGFLGGYTTFSTFSLDAVLLWERGAILTAAAYVIASVVLSLVGLFGGLALVKALT